MKRFAALLVAALAGISFFSGCGSKDDAAAKSAPAPAPAVAEAPAAPAPAVDPGALVATVNGSNISEGDVQKVVEQFMKQMGGRVPPEQLADAMPRIRERIVEELVMRRIMLDALSKENISLSDAEFAEIKAELAQELPPGMSLDAYMAENNVSESEMREQMAVRKMVVAKADAVAKPSDEDIKAFYDENQAGFAQEATVSASHILIKVDRNADDDAAKTAKRERIESLRKQLIEGADFAELAKANSDCPSASSGGDLGSFGRGQMVPEFEDAAFSQEIGAIGEVVETQFGFHLVKVSEKNDAKTLAFDEVKERISDILYSQSQQDAVRSYVDGLRAAADVKRFDEAPESVEVFDLDVPVDDSAEKTAPETESDVDASAETPPSGEVAVPEESPAIPVPALEPTADEPVSEVAVAADEPVVEVVEEAPAAPIAEETEPAANEPAQQAEETVVHTEETTPAP